MKHLEKFTTLLFLLLLAGCLSNNEYYMSGPNTYRSQAPTTAAASSTNGYVTAQKGDTVYGMAKRNNVPLREFIAVNNLKAPYTLSIGQKLKLPTAAMHTVAKGETIYSISRRYNVDMSSLVRMNNINSPYTISVGQKLHIPSSIVEESKPQPPKTTTTAKNTTVPAQKATTTAAAKSYTPPTRSGGKFAWPLKGKVISPYGQTGKGQHNDGINIEGTKGATITAAENGVVAYTGNELAGYGNLLLIKHSDGWMSAYAHNDTITVKKGDKVKKGAPVAKVGSTGNVSSPQLHFELRQGSKAVNPVNYLAQ